VSLRSLVAAVSKGAIVSWLVVNRQPSSALSACWTPASPGSRITQPSSIGKLQYGVPRSAVASRPSSVPDPAPGALVGFVVGVALGAASVAGALSDALDVGTATGSAAGVLPRTSPLRHR
jgi:hypothetical protein